MSYALVVSNAIQSEGVLPASARRLDTQEWVLGLPTASVTLQRACGYFLVTDVAKPADTATLTTDRSLTLVSGTPTVTWTSRNKTAQETTDATAQTNRATLVTQTTSAMSTNTTAAGMANPTAGNTTFSGLANPTTAQVTAQVKALTTQNNNLYAQVIALTQQNNKLIRLALGLYDGTT